mgnify:CR=1 FL=1|tara:strand:- start:7529 stop:8188 length:660 start_codon:yes stop_codon:yes gene_type:complete
MANATREDKLGKHDRLMKRLDPDIVIYVDGSIRMKSKCGGGGIVTLDRRKRDKPRTLLTAQLHYGGGFMTSATSELATFIVGLLVAKQCYYSGIKVLLLCDCDYAVQGYNSWMDNWLEKDILYQKANFEYWEHIKVIKDSFVENSQVFIKHIHGHTDSKKLKSRGIVGNYIADLLANRGSDSKESKTIVDLGGAFKGSVAKETEEILHNIGIEFAWDKL